MTHRGIALNSVVFGGGAVPEKINTFCFKTEVRLFYVASRFLLHSQSMQIQIQYNLNDKG